MVNELFKVVYTGDCDLIRLDGEIRTKETACNLPTSAAMAEVSSSVAREEFRVVHLNRDGAAQAVSFHLNNRYRGVKSVRMEAVKQA